MNLYLRLAWRNIWRHRRRTLIVKLAIGLTMSLMMIFDGMMAGFNNAIYANAIKVLGGNIQAHAAGFRETEDENPLLPLPDDTQIVEAARALPQVEAASRRITTTGMATSPEGAFGVSIIGIEPEGEAPVNLIAQPEMIVAGGFHTSADRDVVYIGKGLAIAMGVGAGGSYRSPMAIVSIGGLVAGGVLALLAIPPVYKLVWKLKQRFGFEAVEQV